MADLAKMREIIKSILLDFQDIPFQTGIPRNLQIKVLPKKATICMGVRRCGKSTYMFQIIRKLLDRNVPLENILYLNFFDDRLHELRKENLGEITEVYYSLYPHKKNTETIYCFFDEIQMISGWEIFVDRLIRTENCEIYITGSSARMLSKEIATEMRGRALSWEMFPFSFDEFLDYKKLVHTEPLSTKKQFLIRNAFDIYFETGGFPEVIVLERHLRIKVHQEYFQSILYRDLVERHDISHPKALADLAHWLMNNIASLYSINNVTGYLKSLGHKIHKQTVSDYLAWFEDAYFLYSIRLFDASLSRSNANPKKIYCVDHSFVTSISSKILVNSGHLLENMVFITLRRFYSDIFYYKTRLGREVDFIIKKKDPALLIQVCESLAHPQTKKREFTALSEAMEELNINRSFIVTKDELDTIHIGKKVIEIKPMWRFLLEFSDQTPS